MTSMQRALIIIVAVIVVLAIAAVVLVLPCSDCPPAVDREISEPPASVEPSDSELQPSDENPNIDEDSESVGWEVSLGDLSAIRAGDSLSLSIPEESRTLQGEVVSIERSTAGNRILSGRLIDPLQPDTNYPFVITVGKNFTFGTIHTSVNRYQMQLKNGVGRMIAATALLKEIDYSEPDFVLPESVQVEESPTQEQP